MVYILLADGFEEAEALVPCDILRRAKINTKLVSVSSRLCVKGRSGISVLADLSLGELRAYNMDMLVLPGGMPGTTNLDELPQTDVLLEHCVNQDKFIGAICAAPSILGKRGILEGKEAICYPGFEDSLKGAKVCKDKRVVRDGKVITAIGAGACVEFGLALVEALTDKETAEKVKESIY